MKPICRAIFSFKNRSVEFSSHDSSVLPALAALIDLPHREDGSADCSIALGEEAGRVAIHAAGEIKLHDTLAGALAALAQSIPFWLLPFGRGYVLHAGAILAGGKAHMFLGPGHVGKSTLALEAWLMGYEILGDDYLVLDPQAVTLEAVPKPMKLRLGGGTLPDRLQKNVAPDAYCLGPGEEGLTLILGRRLPRMTPLYRNFPIGSIHLLTRSGTKKTFCAPADNRAFFRAALEQTIAAPKNGLDVLRCFLPMLGRGRVFALDIGHDDARGAVETMIAAASCA